jgi:RNA polymerase sigma-70 factor, ECF subfamily
VIDNDKALALLASVAQGDQQAFTQLYELCSRSVFVFVNQRVPNPAEAEEIMVDTLVDVWKHPERFRGEAKFSTWLLSIARNKMIDRYRARAPESEDISDYADLLVDEQTPTGFDTLAQQERRAGVMRCMDRLSDEYRESLTLAYYEGMSLTEIAQVAGVPEQTVKSRLFSARQRIKKCMAAVLHAESEPVPLEVQ